MPLKPKVRLVRKRKRRGGATRNRPKAVVTIGNCGSCGKEFVNPLTHVCTGGGDFAERAAAKRKADAAARRAASRHEYSECEDQDCTAFPCRVYREGYAMGHGIGYGSGKADGLAEGYREGYAAGAASSEGK